ncbi:MAG: DUF998 domain-containing protein [Actinomycetota bacterium]
MVRIAASVRALCGLIGPAAFTTAWVIGTRRQRDYSIAHEHISGLAAPDAEEPRMMRAGFLTLGACSVVFASELDRRLDGARGTGWGPALLAAAGVSTVVAGVCTRDRMSNAPPHEGSGDPSITNDAHDIASVVGGVAATAGLLALARRFRDDASWRGLAPHASRAAFTGAVLSGWFLSDVTRPGNGLVQRASVSLPLGFMAWMALRMLRPG